MWLLGVWGFCESIKNVYRQELTKIKKSKKSGAGADDVYQPKLAWFKRADIFLKNVVSSRTKRLRWSRGSVLAFSTQVRGFNPGRSRRIFNGEKILSTPPFGGEVKPSLPCRRFAACKRTLNVPWK
jgi:hypothetical protein